MSLNKYSANQAAKLLGVSIITFRKWILLGKVKVERITVGTKDYVEVKETEIKRLRTLMDKNAKPGQSLLREE